MAHTFGRAWYEVMGDSWNVHANPVEGGKDPGEYMAKYLRKTFGMEGRAKELGMARRWSSSRGWPGRGRMRLEPTVEEDWYESIYRKRPAEDGAEKGTFRKVGTSSEMEAYFAAKAKVAGAKALIRSLDA